MIELKFRDEALSESIKESLRSTRKASPVPIGSDQIFEIRELEICSNNK